MTQNLMLLLALAGALLLGGPECCLGARMEVKGTIVNWPEVKARVPESAYLQVVKLEDNLKGTSDAQGLAAFDSEYPRVTVSPTGAFNVDLQGVPEGRFFIALQRAMPREVEGKTVSYGPPILVTREGQPLIIEVPGSFPKDVGPVVVAVKPVQETSKGGR